MSTDLSSVSGLAPAEHSDDVDDRAECDAFEGTEADYDSGVGGVSARARTAAGKEKNFNKVPRWGVTAGYPVALPCALTTTDGKRDRIVSLMADGLVAHPKTSTSVRSDEGYVGAAESFIEDFVVPTTAEDTMDSATAVESSIINVILPRTP